MFFVNFKLDMIWQLLVHSKMSEHEKLSTEHLLSSELN